MNNTLEALERHWNVPTLAALAVVGIMAMQTLAATSYRSVLTAFPGLRIAMGVVPFRDVTILSTKITPGGLVVLGRVHKVGCDIQAQYAYTVNDDGLTHFAVYYKPDFLPEQPNGKPTALPVVPGLLEFGPLRILPIRPEGVLRAGVVNIYDCTAPFGVKNDLRVTARVFEVPWADNDKPQPETSEDNQ